MRAPIVVRVMDMTGGTVARAFSRGSPLASLCRPLLNRLLPTAPTPVTIRSGPAQGMRIVIDPQREKFYWTGTHEPRVQDALAELLEPGMTFWDVGAHVGFFSLLASRVVGVSGTVHAFEPQPDNYRRLEASIASSGAANVSLHRYALAGAEGPALLHAHDASTNWSLLPEDGGKAGISVPCHTMDSVAEMLGVPEMVKIDVEGGELDVLRGGRRLLRDHRPALLIEFTNNQVPREVHQHLPGYRLQHLAGWNWLARNETVRNGD